MKTIQQRKPIPKLFQEKSNGMSLVQSYENQRNLLTSMAYHRGATLEVL